MDLARRRPALLVAASKLMKVLCSLAAAAFVIAAAPPPGPTPQQFTALRTATGEKCPPIRNLACQPVGDEPVFECKWQEQFEGKPWISGSALIARNGAEWLWLDGGPRCFAIPQY